MSNKSDILDGSIISLSTHGLIYTEVPGWIIQAMPGKQKFALF